jgi:hypothetical protein
VQRLSETLICCWRTSRAVICATAAGERHSRSF